MPPAPTGILLAAGRGRRFDASGAANKLLARLPDGTYVAEASARALLAVLPEVIAVVPPDDGGVAELLRGLGCRVTVCVDADSGMAASLVHGLRALPAEAPSWVVALADMPQVRSSTIDALARALGDGAQIAVPVHAGQRGNPVGFGRQHLPALLVLRGDQGARALARTHPVCEVAVNDPGVLLDVDTPVDLLNNATLQP